MICMRCGKTIEEGQKFCTWCGSDVQLPVKTSKRGKGKNMLSQIAVFLAVLILLSTIGPLMYFGWNSIHKQVNLDIEMKSYQTEAFVRQIAAYIDKSEYEIIPTDHSSFGSYNGDSCIRTDVTVKPNGGANVEIGLNFVGPESKSLYDDHDGPDSNVTSICLKYTSNDSQVELLCKTAVLEALEKAICGKSFVAKATNQLHAGGAMPSHLDETIIDSYSLGSRCDVVISCEIYPDGEWFWEYYLSIS